MGLRFRRTLGILPGVRLNFSKSGVSTSVGVRGAHVTLGRTGVRTTVGLPGSGLSYTHLERGAPARAPLGLRLFVWIGLVTLGLWVLA
jgi:hypothetical protein